MVNMSDPKTLRDFIEWGVKKYPAQHYMLIVSDHGAGWEGAVEDKSHKGWMDLPDIKKAIAGAEETTGEKLDVLGFDACLMAQAEAAYELKDAADLMLASEEEIGGEGWNYSQVLGKAKPAASRQELTANIMDSARKNPDNFDTFSAIDLKQITPVVKAIDRLALAILKNKKDHTALRKIISQSQDFDTSSLEIAEPYRDLWDLAANIKAQNGIKDPELIKSARELLNALKPAVKANVKTENSPRANGLSIYAACDPQGRKKLGYPRLQFAQNTSWEKAMQKLFGVIDA